MADESRPNRGGSVSRGATPAVKDRKGVGSEGHMFVVDHFRLCPPTREAACAADVYPEC
jgi:hypothetical protein